MRRQLKMVQHNKYVILVSNVIVRRKSFLVFFLATAVVSYFLPWPGANGKWVFWLWIMCKLKRGIDLTGDCTGRHWNALSTRSISLFHWSVSKRKTILNELTPCFLWIILNVLELDAKVLDISKSRPCTGRLPCEPPAAHTSRSCVGKGKLLVNE